MVLKRMNHAKWRPSINRTKREQQAPLFSVTLHSFGMCPIANTIESVRSLLLTLFNRFDIYLRQTICQFSPPQSMYPDQSVDGPAMIFGDGLGAAGFDSKFYGHLPKNWSNAEQRKKHLAMVHKNSPPSEVEQRIPAPLGGSETFSMLNLIVL